MGIIGFYPLNEINPKLLLSTDYHCHLPSRCTENRRDYCFSNSGGCLLVTVAWEIVWLSVRRHAPFELKQLKYDTPHSTEGEYVCDVVQGCSKCK